MTTTEFDFRALAQSRGLSIEAINNIVPIARTDWTAGFRTLRSKTAQQIHALNIKYSTTIDHQAQSLADFFHADVADDLPDLKRHQHQPGRPYKGPPLTIPMIRAAVHKRNVQLRKYDRQQATIRRREEQGKPYTTPLVEIDPLPWEDPGNLG